MKLRELILGLFVTISVIAQANDAWNWGDSPIEAQGEYENLKVAVEIEEYEMGRASAAWLLKNAPELSEELYILSSNVYANLEKKEGDEARKMELQDTVLMIYDNRVAYFGNEAAVLNRKGKVAWSYLSTRDGKDKELYDLYGKIYTLNGNSMSLKNAYYYMKSACLELENGEITKNAVLELYTQLNSFLDAQDESRIEYVNSSRYKIMKEMDSHVTLSYEEIEANQGAVFRANPTLREAKEINKLLIKNKCTANELFIETSEMISENKPSAARYRKEAKVHQKLAQDDKAIAKYQKSIAIEEDAAKKSKSYLSLAGLSLSNGKHQEARSHAYESLALNPNNKKAYSLIGDVYMKHGVATCGGDNELEKRLVYLAAYDMYEKAGNSSKMNMAKQQFPTMEQIFTQNHNVGDKMNTGCWINKSVTLRKK